VYPCSSVANNRLVSTPEGEFIPQKALIAG
jgi:hypothetical protein